MAGADTEKKPEEKPPAKEPENPKELEEDSPPDTRKKLGKDVCINPPDTTLDVCPALNGKLLQGLSDGGFSHLLSGARANVGVKSGRYAFEVTLLERVSKEEAVQVGIRQPAQFFKVGFSTAKSSLFMNDPAESFCFDSEGMFSHSKTKVYQTKIVRADVVTVVVNLNSGSAYSGNTVSLFKNGKRLTDPQAIPENLLGKALYPTFTFKNVTLLVNFGPTLTKTLPFKVTTLAEVAEADAEVSPILPPKNGKFEVHYPVGIPDEGTYDFVDQFLEENPSFVELSDRAIVSWASQSGLTRQKEKLYNDKFAAGLNFGVASIDDLSVHKILQTLAPATQRNFVVMDVANNLTENGRKEGLQRFSGPQWKKIAQVAMGAPPEKFKKHLQKLILAQKQKELEAEHKKKLAVKEKEKEAIRRKKVAEKAAALVKAKREAAIARAKKIREKKERAAKKAAERKEMGLEGPFSESEDEPAEEVKPPEEPEEEADEPMEPCPQAELTEDDLAVTFRTQAVKDLAPQAVSKIFRSVSLPQEAEGFDEIKYCWEGKSKASAYIKEWVLKNKQEQRIEDLTPGEWFKEKCANFSKDFNDLKRKQNEFKKDGKVSKKEGEEEAKADGEVPEVDFEDLNVMGVEDIDDIDKKGKPLYCKFDFEDWALLSIRFELYALVKSFAKDLNDPDIPGITEQHFGYYYQKYYKKQLSLKGYGCEGLKELAALVKDALSINDANKVLETTFGDDVEFAQFVKLTEENRRERERRVDAGDETARLKFARSVGGGAAPMPRPTGTPTARVAPKAGGAPATGASRYSGGARASYYGSAAPGVGKRPAPGGVAGGPAKVAR
eukprot:gnl/MRDRNA2_/MRDRNA2_94917_c0_seq1.p1 gnl/MRDRNA2_/MRDRNA2_94917_c0~~gnl/MRDRNA2_/MRDRNA2_94917_c0_seq1.p1  ORF type:complete len:837 (-),score=250.36 gnl/MRDRNA2_/MRDRNA2_94917_c0_seq1:64-2574(-)